MTELTETADIIHPAFLPSKAFVQWLDSLPPTPRHAKVLAERAKAEEAAVKQRQAERERQWGALRDQRLAEQRDRYNETRRERRGWGKHKKPKHVVTGRLHLMEDDDRAHERTGYAEHNRFKRGKNG